MIDMSLEQEIVMIMFAEENGWDHRFYELFITGSSKWMQAPNWEQTAEEHFLRRNSNNAKFRTIYRCVERQLSIALTSPALYLRTYAELVQNEQPDSEM